MLKLFTYFKKWNWGAFWFVLLFANLGALSNKSITNIWDCIILGLMIGIPAGLLWAWLGKDD